MAPRRIGRTVFRFGAGVSLALGSLWAAPGAGAPPAAPAPIHVDAKDLQQSMLDLTTAFIAGDAKAVRAAFDRTEKDCRRIADDETPPWPQAFVEQDQALHSVLDQAREFAARGDLEHAIQNQQWTIRICRDCHALREPAH
jgi:hypothetical protein